MFGYIDVGLHGGISEITLSAIMAFSKPVNVAMVTSINFNMHFYV